MGCCTLNCVVGVLFQWKRTKILRYEFDLDFTLIVINTKAEKIHTWKYVKNEEKAI